MKKHQLKEYWDEFYKDTPAGDFPQIDFDFVKKYLHAGDILVDLGCGRGTLLKRAQEMGFRVLGVDFSKQVADVPFIQKDLNEPFQIPANVIVSNRVVAFIHNKKAFIQSVYDSLSQGGYFILKTPIRSNDSSQHWQDISITEEDERLFKKSFELIEEQIETSKYGITKTFVFAPN